MARVLGTQDRLLALGNALCPVGNVGRGLAPVAPSGAGRGAAAGGLTRGHHLPFRAHLAPAPGIAAAFLAPVEPEGAAAPARADHAVAAVEDEARAFASDHRERAIDRSERALAPVEEDDAVVVGGNLHAARLRPLGAEEGA